MERGGNGKIEDKVKRSKKATDDPDEDDEEYHEEGDEEEEEDDDQEYNAAVSPTSLASSKYPSASPISGAQFNMNTKRSSPALGGRVDWDSSASYYSFRPAKIPKVSDGHLLASDFCLAAKNKYKSRVTKFVRVAQSDGELAQTSIDNSEAFTESRAQAHENKSRFSFKQDGIVAVSQVIDIFCDGLIYEAMRVAKSRAASGGTPEMTPQDVQHALMELGWGAVNCLHS
mmetsp:Transcript_17473/g.28246  ORF Transcript_17473/g.28246 Transcript_17473/m.28246 type:complete len:229 (+) Transcript_17473:373-1059(+)